MRIDKPKKNDQDTIEKLWKYCFNQDSDEFVKHYFTNIYSPENTLVVIDQEKITTSMQLNPYSFFYHENLVPTKYIIGISSFPEYRGSGGVRKLFDHVFHELSLENVPFIFLMAIDYGLYRPFGFAHIMDKYILTGKTKSLYQKTKKIYEFKKISSDSATEEIAKLTDFYSETISKKHSNYINRNISSFKNILNELKADNGYAFYLLYHGHIFGYLFYYFDNQKIVIKEMLYENTEALKEILKFIYNHNTQFSEFEIRDDFFKTTNLLLQNPREVTTEIMPFLTARIINVKNFLELNKNNLPLEKELRIKIIDKNIEENNIICIFKNEKIFFENTNHHSNYDISIDISLLPPLFFGYLSKEEALLQKHLFCSSTDDIANTFFEMFDKPKNIFFNEYV